ncbi:MAG: hypothetical protein OQL06_13575 [Gammaproteobacteria bacterium]|nr:hypothetical protein [Gammaproteobacteria bacterium]
MSDKPKMTRQEAIDELRREAQELEDQPGSIKTFARNAYQAKIRRELADKFERELAEEKQNNT